MHWLFFVCIFGLSILHKITTKILKANKMAFIAYLERAWPYMGLYWMKMNFIKYTDYEKKSGNCPWLWLCPVAVTVRWPNTEWSCSVDTFAWSRSIYDIHGELLAREWKIIFWTLILLLNNATQFIRIHHTPEKTPIITLFREKPQ